MKDWTHAHNDTDAHIARMAGFTAVLREITWDMPALNNPDPMASGVLAMIRALDEDMRKLQDMRTEEWQLRHQAHVA
ncbi:hypothetical protein [Paracoccus rhizosphaerae]|uniref:Uncharacterized protein n=1 Tax=Paracoccus rhizosphaerae TaxID=1133347 RepID=A0ABV6CN72_9RHOB|nr:hypothetical protein [Paracoccus rhizosphaerae]